MKYFVRAGLINSMDTFNKVISMPGKREGEFLGEQAPNLSPQSPPPSLQAPFL